ncbi:MAG: DUF6569 family protein [Thermodesulfobacteriota bacterium]
MAETQLTKLTFDRPGLTFGRPQRSGAMTVVPLFGPEAQGRFVSPLTGLKISRVAGYGNVELENPDGGVAIVPLHIGYIQHGAQNHALCRSAFIGGGQKLMFKDACCVQSGQGGYLQEKQQWFFVLPLTLREEALKLRGQASFGKLWPAIEKLNARFGLTARGHLEQIIGGCRPYLNQYQSRFELLPNQTGALFFLKDKLAGVELAPNAAYFEEVWSALVCFCYGPMAMEEENKVGQAVSAPRPFPAKSITELKGLLDSSRREVQEEVNAMLARTAGEAFQKTEEERFLNLRLYTLSGGNFIGQCVEEDETLIYASVTATAAYYYRS